MMKTDHYQSTPAKTVGFTNTLGNETLPKSHILIETLGNLDEANSMIGFARSQSQTLETAELLLTIQKDLGFIMASIATVGNDHAKVNILPKTRFTWLEKKKKDLKQTVTIPKGFILPGETSFSAILDLCRTTVRKAERKLTEIYLQKLIDDSLSLQYLNTLSQLFFFLELKTISDESTHPESAIQK
jgi:cob(I)alamin adenosyltransferase